MIINNIGTELNTKFITECLTDIVDPPNYNIRRLDLNIESDAEDFNILFSEIENNLNDLYVKSRLLQDIFDYAEQYIKTTIQVYEEEIKAIVGAIERTRDSIKTREYITMPVLLSNKYINNKDRNGTILASADFINGKITVSGKDEITTNKIESIDRSDTGFIPYRSSDQDLINGKHYRTFYIMNNPIEDGLSEELIIKLESPEYINFVKAVPSNCNITCIKFVTEDGSLINTGNIDGKLNTSSKVSEIRLTLNSKNYVVTTHYVDNNVDEDFWERVNDSDYQNIVVGKTLIDYDSVVTEEAYKLNLNNYLQDLARWENAYADYLYLHQDWEKKKALYQSLSDVIIDGAVPWTETITVAGHWSNQAAPAPTSTATLKPSTKTSAAGRADRLSSYYAAVISGEKKTISLSGS